MDFKEAMKRYEAGTASEEERKLVEEAVVRHQLISDYLDRDWEAELTPTEETIAVRKHLRRHRLAMILAPVAVVLLLAALAVWVIYPAWEGQFYDPNSQEYDTFTTDFELYLTAYTELLYPGYVDSSVYATKTGPGAYQLELMRFNMTTGEEEYHLGHLVRDELTLPLSYTSATLPLNIIERASFPVYTMTANFLDRVREQLEALPEHIMVTAAVSFPMDLSMEEFNQWLDTWMDGTGGSFLWVGVRNAPADRQRYPLCGFSQSSSGYVQEGVNETYPAFELSLTQMQAEDYEQHFRSLLQFLVDQKDFPGGSQLEEAGYFQEVLDYVNEAGVVTYGGVIYASPKTLLGLLDQGAVNQVWPMEAKISF